MNQCSEFLEKKSAQNEKNSALKEEVKKAREETKKCRKDKKEDNKKFKKCKYAAFTSQECKEHCWDKVWFHKLLFCSIQTFSYMYL